MNRCIPIDKDQINANSVVILPTRAKTWKIIPRCRKRRAREKGEGKRRVDQTSRKIVFNHGENRLPNHSVIKYARLIPRCFPQIYSAIFSFFMIKLKRCDGMCLILRECSSPLAALALCADADLYISHLFSRAFVLTAEMPISLHLPCCVHNLSVHPDAVAERGENGVFEQFAFR